MVYYSARAIIDPFAQSQLSLASCCCLCLLSYLQLSVCLCKYYQMISWYIRTYICRHTIYLENVIPLHVTSVFVEWDNHDFHFTLRFGWCPRVTCLVANQMLCCCVVKHAITDVEVQEELTSLFQHPKDRGLPAANICPESFRLYVVSRPALQEKENFHQHLLSQRGVKLNVRIESGDRQPEIGLVSDENSIIVRSSTCAPFPRYSLVAWQSPGTCTEAKGLCWFFPLGLIW